MIVADSHVLLWWILAPHMLSNDARAALKLADVVAIAAISCWEVALLSRRQRIVLDQRPDDWLHGVVQTQNLLVLPLTIEIGVRAAELHDILRDPIDCLIAATALAYRVPLITKDDRIRKSGVVPTIW